MKVAFKKYSQNPHNETNMSNYPWVSTKIKDEEEAHYLENNWIVVSEDEYLSYMSSFSYENVQYNIGLNNKTLKIFDLVHNNFRFNDPSKIDFTMHLKTGVLLKKENIMSKNGRPLISKYYHPTSGDIVAEIKFVFIDNEYRFMIERQEWLGYYNNEGDVPEYYLIHKRTYDFTKIDQATESIVERVTARNNIIQGLKIVVNNFLIQYHMAQGLTFTNAVHQAILTGGALFNAYRLDIYNFVEIASESFKTNLAVDTQFSWLNGEVAPGVTVKAYIIDRVTY